MMMEAFKQSMRINKANGAQVYWAKAQLEILNQATIKKHEDNFHIIQSMRFIDRGHSANKVATADQGQYGIAERCKNKYMGMGGEGRKDNGEVQWQEL